MSKKAIDFILWNNGFYPFSPKFNLEKAAKKYHEELILREVDPTTQSIFTYSKYFNSYFKDICTALQKVLDTLQLDKPLFTELLIADLNRTEILISEETKKVQMSGTSLDRNSLSNTYIQKPEFQNTKESVWGLIDSAIDTAILNLNYLNYISDKNTGVKNEIEQVDIIKHLSMVGSCYNAIKQSYDRIIWGGYIIDDENSVLKLKVNSRHLLLENANLTRLTRNIESKFDELLSLSSKNEDVLRLYHKTRKFQEIKSIEENGDGMIIKYQARKREPSSSFLAFTAPLLTYYPFYRSQEIKAFDNLTILDLVNLFSILRDLVELLPMPSYDDTGIVDLTKFQRFTPKIEKKDLLNHFKTTTKYSEKQISIFLELLINKEEKHYLYRYPIYEIEDKLFFSLSTIKRANILYLIDRWLESGNCDLSDRGYEFEDYITDFFRNEKFNEHAKFSLIDKSKFFFNDPSGKRIEEEIDLVIKTDTSLIIAEVKCITYPLEPDDFYGSFQTLKKAKNQVVRKAKFLEDNWEHFEDVLGEKNGRSIEKIIVVNFPHFSGRTIDNIPIADFYLFLSYFKTGKLTNIKLEFGKKPIINSIPYYTSVETFERNFSGFFLNPVPIDDIISRQEIEEYEITLEGAEPKIIAQRVIYHPRSD